MNAAAISNFCEICGANQYFDEKVLSKKSAEGSEKTVAKIVNSIRKYLNPFEIPISDSKIPLPSIWSCCWQESTKNQVLKAKSIGQESKIMYIQEQLVKRTVSYWDPIKKLKIKSCYLQFWFRAHQGIYKGKREN